MSIPEPDRPHARAGAFTRPDARGLGTEHQVSRFIGDLVRLLAPRVVVETGTAEGDTAALIVEALQANADRGLPGALWTFETSGARIAGARKRLGTPRGLAIVPSSVTAWTPPEPIDLAFVDSAIDTRLEDLQHVERFLAPRGLVAIHDVEMRQTRDVLAHLEEHYRVIRLATPRGLALVQPRRLP